MPNISDIEGIGPANAQKLKDVGITTTEALLTQGATPKGREELAQKTGIRSQAILAWVNRADLFRVKGVGEQFSDLLEAAGVDSVPELARRTPANLHERMVAINEEKKLVRRVPTEAEIAAWVESAKQLPRVVEH
jgi:predicted flap endonuclease-1-like 5' DNA nuclease